MHIAWTSFLIAFVVLLFVPGPDFVLVTGNAMRGSRAGWVTAAGVTCGLMVHACLATLGLSALVAAAPAAMTAVKLLGAAYLGYLGFSTLRRARAAAPAPGEPVVPDRSLRALFLRGVLGDVLNPKVMLLFLTLVPQAIDPHAPAMPQAALLSGVVVAGFALFWSLVVPLARSISGLLAAPRRRRVFERGCGVALIGMAAAVAGS
ncbi:LysE family translocator [Amycolatopsis cihanbeyliensis]|uniref:Threonine/homoserine/homoserine lactone efflux protein n=1 Tax=Amycolatopsis cihanbeyliensis TaxID=1128664 RepID=A0A542DDG9_AMYCI|nr:LysE family translocator [Amycolatopsis cihanbeyliensis]TQJ01124.1 threonine/homoserine/homoserine lactone efflux protein [Amycolatopsis cihanbeyliensis]